MHDLGRYFRSRYFLWLVLAVPWVLMTAGYLTGRLFYGEFVHATGEYSARLLMLAMAVTPLRLLFPRQRWTNWLLQNRRYLGVAAFAYAAPHLAAYLVKLGQFAEILEQGLEPGFWTGWMAIFVLLALATTSNNLAVRKLGRRWKQLHRLVYAAAILTFAHWVLVAFDPVPGLVHAGVLAALETCRIAKTSGAAR